MDNASERMSLNEANAPVSPDTYSFGMFTLRRMGQIFKIIFSKRICILFLVLICLMALLEQYLTYNVGIIPSGFYKVLGDKNFKEFWYHVLKAVLLILAICFVLSCKTYILNVFYVASREILTDKLHLMYFTRNKFYILNTMRYDFTDNPDQRITQDVDKFTKQLSTVVGPFVVAPFTISYYSYTCYQTTGWVGPVAVFAVFLISVVINKVLIKPIMALVIKQEKCEGFFRFKHMHVRSNAESIAFQDANIAEMARSEYKLLDLIKTQQMLYLRQFSLDVAVNIFSYTGSIVSYLILAYPIFMGKYDNLTPSELSALISVNAFVAIYLISCFSSLINISTNISELGGLTHRICEILDTLKGDDSASDEELLRNSRMKLKPRSTGDVKDPVIELQNVTFSAPRDSKILISGISLHLRFGINLLISGKSSSGKTSLFRVIKGLWPIEEGKITRRLPFQPSLIFFLPQHPLLTDGSLIEQIVYPLEMPNDLKPKDEDIDSILKYIKYAELEHILLKAGLFDKVDWNWYDVLSPGECQRLSFVRLFCHKPKMAFLDEATSALDVELEEKLYKKCKELDITVISIGHRRSLVQFHDSFLHLDGVGGWTLSNEPPPS
ncbi:lysosomal cobalamin transporter ABCD4-like [Argiope bruennichi]|uniref:lysosomal cobalamin transporter ABCD4-like n=1 Tax=Argiope bruennichi TaxID=94029 RepID=UPI0024944D5F|nr:lysosomal cobalamin transporter ABCD4-like [Argiope bruennichi]